MYGKANAFLKLLRAIMNVLGFLCGIAGYGMFREKLHTIALALPFAGALIGTAIAYVIYGFILVFIYLTCAIERKGGPLAHNQKKVAVSLVFFAMLAFFIYVCSEEKQAIATYFSAMSFNIFLLVINPCVYPVTALTGNAPYVENTELVRTFYITLIAFAVFVILLFLYSEWSGGTFSETAYHVVTVDRESGSEISRKSVSWGEVITWENILKLLILTFSVLTWPPITIVVLLVRMYGWDYLC